MRDLRKIGRRTWLALSLPNDAAVLARMLGAEGDCCGA